MSWCRHSVVSVSEEPAGRLIWAKAHLYLIPKIRIIDLTKLLPLRLDALVCLFMTIRLQTVVTDEAEPRYG